MKIQKSVAWPCLAVAGVFALAANVVADDDWSQFRGPNINGAVAATMPTEWSDSNNVNWSVDMPGPGSSSPICLDGKIYLTCYTGYGESVDNPGDPKDLKRHLLCYDLKSGKELWRSTVDSAGDEDPYKGFITEHGYASSTPVCDGAHVFAFFGKSGICAFSAENGEQLWQKNLGTESDPAKWGGGASPVVYENLVIVNAGNEGRKVVALDKKSGEEVWSVQDDSFASCWSTPLLVDSGERTELVCSMPGKIWSFDPKTGETLWTCKSPIEGTVCASLVQHDGMVFAMGGRQGRCMAVKCGGAGDVSDSHVVWQRPVNSSIGTPVIVDGKLVWSSRSILLCLDCATGDEVYKGRMGGEQQSGGGSGRRSPQGNYASPVAAGSNVFMLLRSGATIIVNANDKFTQVSVNKIEESEPMFNATPAFVGDQILIRSQQKLYCIGK